MSTDRSDPSLAYTLPSQLTKKIHRQVPDALQPENRENTQEGKIVVITGGGTGIGAAAARVWVRAKAAGVVIVGRRKERLDETARALNELSGGATKVLAVPTDLLVEHEVRDLFAQVNKTFGRPADVVIANAGWVTPLKPLADEAVSTWWSVYEINVLGLHNTVAGWIRSQPNPQNPVGTVININSGLAGHTVPGNSAYSTSKLAANKYMEFVGAEYPEIRSFTLLPGIVKTDLLDEENFGQYAKDEAEMTGATALYLVSDRADYLKNSLMGVNWDIEEMEARKTDIQNGLLKVSWIPVLPVSGGSGI